MNHPMRPSSLLLASLLSANAGAMSPGAVTPPGVYEYTLSNGFTIWLNEDHSTSKVIGTVVVRAGAKDTPNTGIAHYFEHIMFKGTERIGTIDFAAEEPYLNRIRDLYAELSEKESPEDRLRIQKAINEESLKAAEYAIPNEFNTLITRYGGTGLNAATSYDYTMYFNTFSPRYLEQWCMLNSERFIHPVFRLFQSELETVYEEKNMYEDRLGSAVVQALLERFAAPHPYRYPIIGSTEHLKNPDLRAMSDFYDRYYVAGNMGLILVGDFEREQVIPILEKTFGRLRPGDAPAHRNPAPKPLRGAERFDVKFPIPFVQAAAFAWHTVPNTHPDALGMEVLGRLLSNAGKTGMLDRLAVSGKLMTAAGTSLMLNEMGAFAVMAVPNPPFGTFRTARKMLREVVGNLKSGDFDNDLFLRIKNEILREHLLNIESPEDRSRVLVSLYGQGQHWNDLQEDLNRLESMTKQDLVDLANKYLTENYLEVRKKTGKYPKDKIDKPPFKSVAPKNLGKHSLYAKELEEVPVAPPKYNYIDLAAEDNATNPGSNPLCHLYVRPNPINKVFSLDMVFRKGYGDDPKLKYLADYLDFVGTESKTVEQFNEQLQTLGAVISSRAGRDAFTLSLKGFDENFESSLKLLCDLLYHAQPDEKKMKQIVSMKKVSEKAVFKDPDAISRRLFHYVSLRDNAPHMKDLSLRELKGLKGSDLIQSLRDLSLAEVDVHYVGKLSSQEVSDLLSRSLDLAKITQKGSPLNDREYEAVKQTTIYFYDDPSATQSVVRGYKKLEDLSREELEVTTLLANYLGGGMNSLLFQEIREFRSLAYGVQASLHQLPPVMQNESPEISFYLSTQADKVSEAVATLISLVNRSHGDSTRVEATKDVVRNYTINLYPSFRNLTKYVVSLKQKGYTEDMILKLLKTTDKYGAQDVQNLSARKLQDTPMVVTIVGSKKRADMDALSKLGRVVMVKRKDFSR